jgi:hypothetical protein
MCYVSTLRCLSNWNTLAYFSYFDKIKVGSGEDLEARGSVVGWGTMLQIGRSRFRFQMWWLDLSIDLFLPHALRPWGRLSPVAEIFLGGKERPAHKANNLTAICEPIVQKMWEPRPLTTLWAFTACCRVSFTFVYEMNFLSVCLCVCV